MLIFINLVCWLCLPSMTSEYSKRGGFRQSALAPPGKKGAWLEPGHSVQQPSRKENPHQKWGSLPVFYLDAHWLRAWGCPLKGISRAQERKFPRLQVPCTHSDVPYVKRKEKKTVYKLLAPDFCWQSNSSWRAGAKLLCWPLVVWPSSRTALRRKILTANSKIIVNFTTNSG